MEILTKKIGNRKYQFVNDSWSTSNAWGHKTNVIRNGYDYGTHKHRYYNRTWESYTYQSCMYGAIEEIKERELERFINNYKYQNNIERFKKGQKEEVIKLFEKNEIARDLKKLRKAIEERKFD